VYHIITELSVRHLIKESCDGTTKPPLVAGAILWLYSHVVNFSRVMPLDLRPLDTVLLFDGPLSLVASIRTMIYGWSQVFEVVRIQETPKSGLL